MANKIFAKEYAAAIIDVIEDFLTEKDVVIDNDEHDNIEDEAIIYGSDFDFLMDKIVGTISELCSNIGCEVDTENWPY